jgi:hypothetical protein
VLLLVLLVLLLPEVHGRVGGIHLGEGHLAGAKRAACAITSFVLVLDRACKEKELP